MSAEEWARFSQIRRNDRYKSRFKVTNYKPAASARDIFVENEPPPPEQVMPDNQEQVKLLYNDEISVKQIFLTISKSTSTRIWTLTLEMKTKSLYPI